MYVVTFNSQVAIQRQVVVLPNCDIFLSYLISFFCLLCFFFLMPRRAIFAWKYLFNWEGKSLLLDIKYYLRSSEFESSGSKDKALTTDLHIKL